MKLVLQSVAIVGVVLSGCATNTQTENDFNRMRRASEEGIIRYQQGATEASSQKVRSNAKETEELAGQVKGTSERVSLLSQSCYKRAVEAGAPRK